MILQSNQIGFVSAFLGGVAVGFSPCVYPLIPVTLSFIGIEAGSSRIKGLFLSLVYVLGMAITYSVLGLVAALSGKLFGRISAHPVAPLIVGNVCILAGLSFLDVFHFNFSIPALHHKIKKTGGYLAALLLGLASGLIAGPCTAPALGVILTYVASKNNIVYGASLLFVFAYGMGFLLILSGMFGAVFFNFAKSEILLARIRKISSFILLGIGEYFIIQAGRLM